MSDCEETVVLVLKDVMFHHTETKFLDEFLTEKYGFTKIEDKIKEITKSKMDTTQKEPGNNILNNEVESKETKYSATKILSGSFADSEIKIHILGELTQREDTIEIDKENNYKVYNTKHQLIKIASRSGYAITKLIEQLNIDLGLEIKIKEWLFHRTTNA